MTIQSIRNGLRELSDAELRQLAADFNDGVVPPEVDAALGPATAAAPTAVVINREATLTAQELRLLTAGIDADARLSAPEQATLRALRARLSALSA